jgi:hypothetical protein
LVQDISAVPHYNTMAPNRFKILRVDTAGEVTKVAPTAVKADGDASSLSMTTTLTSETSDTTSEPTSTSTPSQAASPHTEAAPLTAITSRTYPHVATKVSFSQIKIREYPIIVGDNPSIMTGVPITIDWKFVHEMNFSVDDYEAARPQPRTMLELRIPGKNRDDILKRQGFSLADRNRGRKEANIARGRRRRTREKEQLAAMAEAVEKVRRAALNATVFRRRKQKERQLLSTFQEH